MQRYGRLKPFHIGSIDWCQRKLHTKVSTTSIAIAVDSSDAFGCVTLG